MAGKMICAPTLFYRLRYLWPKNERELVNRLHAAVLAGVLTWDEALTSYQREAWIVRNKVLRACLSLWSDDDREPTLTFLAAAQVRQTQVAWQGVYKEWSEDR